VYAPSPGPIEQATMFGMGAMPPGAVPLARLASYNTTYDLRAGEGPPVDRTVATHFTAAVDQPSRYLVAYFYNAGGDPVGEVRYPPRSGGAAPVDMDFTEPSTVEKVASFFRAPAGGGGKGGARPTPGSMPTFPDAPDISLSPAVPQWVMPVSIAAVVLLAAGGLYLASKKRRRPAVTANRRRRRRRRARRRR